MDKLKNLILYIVESSNDDKHLNFHKLKYLIWNIWLEHYSVEGSSIVDGLIFKKGTGARPDEIAIFILEEGKEIELTEELILSFGIQLVESAA